MRHYRFYKRKEKVILLNNLKVCFYLLTEILQINKILSNLELTHSRKLQPTPTSYSFFPFPCVVLHTNQSLPSFNKTSSGPWSCQFILLSLGPSFSSEIYLSLKLDSYKMIGSEKHKIDKICLDVLKCGICT